jgi:subtilisin
VLKRLLFVLSVLAAVTACMGSASAATIPGQYVVVLKGDSSPKTAAAKYGVTPTHVYTAALDGFSAALSSSQVKKLLADSSVEYVDPDQTFSAASGPYRAASVPIGNGEFVANAVTRVGGLRSPTAQIDGADQRVNIDVAVLDTGIDTTHPDLNVVGGIDCTSGTGIDDPNGHGTLVAGLVGELDNNFGLVGVAPGARLWSVRVLNKQGNGSTSQVLCGLDWVTAHASTIEVANMSIVGHGSDNGNCGNRPHREALHQAICASVAAGVTYVVAAGNDSQDAAKTIPAAYDEVLTATAISDLDGQPGGTGSLALDCAAGQADDIPASFSNFVTLTADQAHTIAAPGVCDSSTYPGGLYAVGDGTSVASPITAGTVALCIASGACAGLTPAQISKKIGSDDAAYNTANPSYGFTGDPLHSPDPNRYYGYLIRAGLY